MGNILHPKTWIRPDPSSDLARSRFKLDPPNLLDIQLNPYLSKNC